MISQGHILLVLAVFFVLVQCWFVCDQILEMPVGRVGRRLWNYHVDSEVIRRSRLHV